MNRRLLRVLAILNVTLFVAPAAAFSDCSTLAKWGIYDYRSTTTDAEQVSSFASWFCSVDIGSYQQAKQVSASLGFPIEGIPVKLGWDQNESTWNTWKKSFCSSVATNTQQRTAVSQFLKTVNPSVIEAVNSCLKFPGVHAWLTQGADAKKFLINLAFTGFSSITKATVKDVLISPASVQRTCMPTLPLDASHRLISTARSLTVLCERPQPDSVLIAINADQPMTVEGTLALNEVSSTPPSPRLPAVKLERFCATGGPAGHANAFVDVGQGFKIVGGGANVNWNSNGNFLVASFPETLTRWRSWSKDHSGSGMGGPDDKATITVCAIGLYDPNDEWDVRVFSVSSPPNAPGNSAVATVGDGYLMTGGGASVPDDPVGQLLYGSYPNDKRSWVAKSHDKYVTSRLAIAAYAIGIKPRNGATLPEARIVNGSGNNGSPSSGTVSPDAGWLMTSGGAFADFSGDGKFITGSMPTDGAWFAKSTDQGTPDKLSVKIYLLEIQAISKN